MIFAFTDEQEALRDAVRELATRGRTEPVPGDAPHDPALWSALAELGALGLPFPEESGGMGASPVEVMIVASELGRAGIRTAYAEALVAGSLLAASPDGGELLGSLCAGDSFVVPALYEPNRAWSLEPVGVIANDDRLTGVREPIPYAAAADAVVTSARAGDGVAVFVIESPALSGARLDLAGVAARRLDGADRASVARAVNLGTLTLCAEALGAMDTALTMTVEYLKTRKQFGVPLARFQTLTQRAADMYTSLELARSTVQFAAMTLAADPDDAATVNRLKVVVGKAGRHIGQEAIQLHGGIGVTAEYAVGHLTARLTAIEHSYGDTRQHLAALAGRVGDYQALDLIG